MSRASVVMSVRRASTSAVRLAALLQAAVLFAGAGCAPPLVVRAVVVDENHAPVRGARIYMDCPQILSGSGESLLARTGRDGEAAHEEHPLGRWIHDRCSLLVRPPVDVLDCTEEHPVREVCSDRWSNRCVEATVSSVLPNRCLASDAP